MIGEPLEQWHLDAIEVQDSQVDAFSTEQFQEFLEAGVGYAVLDTDQTVLALFVLYPVDQEGRYMAITVLARDLGTRRLLGVARKARKWLDEWGEYRRVEAYCVEDAVDELHWCRYVLKMELEGKLRCFMPDGRAAYLFARVRYGD